MSGSATAATGAAAGAAAGGSRKLARTESRLQLRISFGLTGTSSGRWAAFFSNSITQFFFMPGEYPTTMAVRRRCLMKTSRPTSIGS